MPWGDGRAWHLVFWRVEDMLCPCGDGLRRWDEAGKSVHPVIDGGVMIGVVLVVDALKNSPHHRNRHAYVFVDGVPESCNDGVWSFCTPLKSV